MDCTRYEELMSAALDGELSPQERQELDRHLAGCPACAALFDELGAQCAALRELDCPFPDGLHDRILNDLPEQEKAPVRKTLHWRRWGAAAACLVLVAALAGAVVPMLPAQTGESAPTGMTDGEMPLTDEGVCVEGEGPSADYAGGGDSAQRSGASPEAVEDDGAANEKNAESASYAAPGNGIDGMGEPAHYWFANDQYLRVAYGYTPEPGARIIGSTQSLEEFLDQFPFDGLTGLFPQYDEAYFETGQLLAVVVEEPSGSVRHRILPQRGLSTTGQVTIQRQVPEICTDDMAAWLILAETNTFYHDGDELTVTIIPDEGAEP